MVKRPRTGNKMIMTQNIIFSYIWADTPLHGDRRQGHLHSLPVEHLSLVIPWDYRFFDTAPTHPFLRTQEAAIRSSSFHTLRVPSLNTDFYFGLNISLRAVIICRSSPGRTRQSPSVLRNLQPNYSNKYFSHSSFN